MVVGGRQAHLPFRAVGPRALAGDTAMETKGWDRVVGGWGKGTQL